MNVDTRAESREQETPAHIVEMGASLASLLCNRNVRVSLCAIYQAFVCVEGVLGGQQRDVVRSNSFQRMRTSASVCVAKSLSE